MLYGKEQRCDTENQLGSRPLFGSFGLGPWMSGLGLRLGLEG